MPDRKYASRPAPQPQPVTGGGTSSSPVILYKHQFEGTPIGSKPYVAMPNVLSSYLSNSSWITSQANFGVYDGITGKSLSLPTASPATSTITLTFDVAAGYNLNVTSFSFYRRNGGSSGYTNWSLAINGITVGSGTVTSTFAQEAATVANSVTGLTGTVTVVLTLSGGTHGPTNVFRLDDFTLNGYIMELPMEVAGRGSANTNEYRYGFNGKERDDEDYGAGNAYDFGARIYDPRLGRWLSTDPLSEKYPALSPYNFVANSPVLFIDNNGKDFLVPYHPEGIPGFSAFKSIIENHYNNLVVVNYNKATYSQKEHIGIPYTGDYFKVSMTINEERLTELAKSKTTDPNLLEEKKREILNGLYSTFSYSQLSSLMNGSCDAVFTIANGSTQGQNSQGFRSPQHISPNNITPYDGIPGLSAFSMLFHEIMEGVNIQNLKGKNDQDWNWKQYGPYGSGHWYAMEDQAKDLGVEFMWSSGKSDETNGHYYEKGELIIVTYKKGQDKKLPIEKTTYRMRYENGQNMGLSGKIEKENINLKTFKDEKRKAKEALQNYERK